jgi:endonuclease YncB( thermonuclease family)
MPSRPFPGKIVSVHDGDTVTVHIDQGFKDWKHDQKLRIYGISALETEMPGGPEAAVNLAALLPAGMMVMLHSHKIDRDPSDDMTWGRYVVEIEIPDPRYPGTAWTVSLGDMLIQEGWAVYWDGKTKIDGKPPYPVWPRVTAGGRSA